MDRPTAKRLYGIGHSDRVPPNETEQSASNANGTPQKRQIISELKTLEEKQKVRAAVARLTPPSNSVDGTSGGKIKVEDRSAVGSQTTPAEGPFANGLGTDGPSHGIPGGVPRFLSLPQNKKNPYAGIPSQILNPEFREDSGKTHSLNDDANSRSKRYTDPHAESTNPDEDVRSQYGRLPSLRHPTKQESNSTQEFNEKTMLGDSLLSVTSKEGEQKSGRETFALNSSLLIASPIQLSPSTNINQSEIKALPVALSGLVRMEGDKLTEKKCVFGFKIPKPNNARKFDKFKLKFTLEDSGVPSRGTVAKFDLKGRDVKNLSPVVLAHSLSLVCGEMEKHGVTRILFKNPNEKMRDALLQKDNDVIQRNGVISIPTKQVSGAMQRVIDPSE
jgi:hypothetical protein